MGVSQTSQSATVIKHRWIQAQYVVPQFLKPRQAHFGHRDEWDFETSQQM